MTTDRFDVAVIGAGPAGSAAAFTAAAAGLSVALIDHRRFPRNKLCGGLITGRSLRYYREIFGAPLSVEPLERREVIEFRFQGRPAGRVEDAPPLYLSMRWDLDHHLYRKAIARGAADLTGQGVAEIDLPARRLKLRDGGDLTFGLLIGADGVNSRVAHSLFGASFDRARIGFGLEVEATGREIPASGPISVDIAAAAWGYGWCFPKSCGATIGVGGLLARNQDMKAEMAAYLEGLGIPQGSYAVKGHFLPFGDFRQVPGRDAALLVGDAAGLVDPITGEGIAYAMKSGALAARAAATALREGAPQRALTLYRHELRPIHRALKIAGLLRPMIYLPGLQGAFERAFRNSATVRRLYLDLLAGEAEYGALLRACLWRAPRLAGLALRSGVAR